MDSRPAVYVRGSASAARRTLRSAAARNPMGRPVVDTTRRPSAALPGVRPFQASRTAKYTHWMAKMTTSSTPIPAAMALSAASVAAAMPMATITTTNAMTTNAV